MLKCQQLSHFNIYEHGKPPCSVELSMKKSSITSGQVINFLTKPENLMQCLMLIPVTEVHLYLEILACDPMIYTMNHPRFILSNRMEEYIGIPRFNSLKSRRREKSISGSLKMLRPENGSQPVYRFLDITRTIIFFFVWP